MFILKRDTSIGPFLWTLRNFWEHLLLRKPTNTFLKKIPWSHFVLHLSYLPKYVINKDVFRTQSNNEDEVFCEKRKLSTVHYFRKNLHPRYLAGFLIRLPFWLGIFGKLDEFLLCLSRNDFEFPCFSFQLTKKNIAVCFYHITITFRVNLYSAIFWI